MPDMCPCCENAVRHGDKFCSTCARPLFPSAQQTISSNIGDRNTGTFIGSTLQNTNINFHEVRGEPIASIECTQQYPLKLRGHPVKTGWFIFAGALGILAQLADISSGFFSGQLHTYMPFWVGMGVMMIGGLCFIAGVQLYRFRFLPLAGQYALQSAQDNSVHLIKISGICPICSGELTLRRVGPKEQKILMVVCKRNPFRHQWLFDHTVIRDIT